MARARGPRCSTNWGSIPLAGTTLTAAGGTIIASLNATALAARPFTVVRTYLELFVQSDQAAAIELQGGAVAFAIVSEQVATAGVGSVPTPVTDLASDLFYLH